MLENWQYLLENPTKFLLKINFISSVITINKNIFSF